MRLVERRAKASVGRLAPAEPAVTAKTGRVRQQDLAGSTSATGGVS
jgi:hypothetical protein